MNLKKIAHKTLRRKQVFVMVHFFFTNLERSEIRSYTCVWKKEWVSVENKDRQNWQHN